MNEELAKRVLRRLLERHPELVDEFRELMRAEADREADEILKPDPVKKTRARPSVLPDPTIEITDEIRAKARLALIRAGVHLPPKR